MLLGVCDDICDSDGGLWTVLTERARGEQCTLCSSSSQLVSCSAGFQVVIVILQ